MKILPHSKRKWTQYPISSKNPDGTEEFFPGVIEISDGSFAGLLAGTHCFNDTLEMIIPWIKTGDELAKENKTRRRSEIQGIICSLKADIAKNDYKRIKCAECSLLNLPLSYDIHEIHAADQAKRDEINALESELAQLGV